jgi:hypothetical protein
MLAPSSPIKNKKQKNSNTEKQKKMGKTKQGVAKSNLSVNKKFILGMPQSYFGRSLTGFR